MKRIGLTLLGTLFFSSMMAAPAPSIASQQPAPAPAAAVAAKVAETSTTEATVTKQFFISASPQAAMRMDPKPSSTILRFLPKGSSVTLVQFNSDKHYALVQTKDGDEGWVGASNLLAATAVSGAASDQPESLKQKLGQGFSSALHNITDWRLARKSKIDAITNNNDQLVVKLKNLEQENQMLASDSSRAWFVIGACVFLAGLLVGLLIGRSMKKRTNW